MSFFSPEAMFERIMRWQEVRTTVADALRKEHWAIFASLTRKGPYGYDLLFEIPDSHFWLIEARVDSEREWESQEELDEALLAELLDEIKAWRMP